jgi:hypothetical protein
MQKKRSFGSVGIGHLVPTGPDFGVGAHDAGRVRRARSRKKNARRDNLNSVRFVRFHFEMFHEQPAVVGGHLSVVSLRDGIRRSLRATFEHIGFLAEDRKVRHRYLLVEAAEGSHDVRDSFQVGLRSGDAPDGLQVNSSHLL